MSNPLVEYLSALDARDAHEKAHTEYVDAYSRLANRTAALASPAAAPELASASTVAVKTTRPATPKGKAPASPDVASPSALAQLRAELAATQRTRGDLEAKLSALSAELAALQASDSRQKQRIEQLEKAKAALERRGRDRADELKGKGRFVEEVQDEMVALNLQLNMAEQDKERLRKENEELTRRWVQKMDDEARRMNDRMGWEEPGRRKGSRS